MGFFTGFAKGFADGYNAEVAANKAAALEAQKYNMQLKASKSYDKMLNDNANTVNFGPFSGFMTPDGSDLELSYVRAYNSKDADYHADNIRQMNKLANQRMIIGVNELNQPIYSNVGEHLLKLYANDSTRASVEPLVNNMLAEYTQNYANYEKQMKPTGADSKNKFFDINKALGVENLNPFFQLMNNKNIINKYNKANINTGMNNGQPQRLPNYVPNPDKTDQKFTFSLLDQNTNKKQTFTVYPKDTAPLLEKMANNSNMSMNQFLDIYISDNEMDVNSVLGINNTNEKKVRAAVILGSLNNSIKNGDFGSLNAETLTKLTQGFLNDEDAEMYLGAVDTDRPEGSTPDRLSALHSLVDVLAFYLPDNITQKVQVPGSVFGETITPDIEAAVQRYGYKDVEDVKTAFNNVDKVFDRIDRMNTLITDDAPTGSLLVGATVLGKGLFALPQQLMSLTGTGDETYKEESFVSRNFKRVFKGRESKYGSVETFVLFQTDAENAKEKYNEFVEKNVGENKKFRSIQQLNDAYKKYRTDIQNNRQPDKELDGLHESYAAIMNMHAYLLAFEMAAAAQGGGDSRTISDRDVRIMQNVIFSKFMATDDFKAVLTEIQTSMGKFREAHGVMAYAVGSGKGPAHVHAAGKLIEQGGPIDAYGKDIEKRFRYEIAKLNKDVNIDITSEDSVYEQNFGGATGSAKTETGGGAAQNVSTMGETLDISKFPSTVQNMTFGDLFNEYEKRARFNQNKFMAEDKEDILNFINQGMNSTDPIPAESFINLIGTPSLAQDIRQALENQQQTLSGDISAEEMLEIDEAAKNATTYNQ